MKKTAMVVLFLGLVLGMDAGNSTFFKSPFGTVEAKAAVRWVNSARCSGGGYYRDTSNDGNPYNNANYLGYND